MAVSIDWDTGVISVPKADLTFISGTLYELDTDAFRQELNSLQAGDVGIVWPTTHLHNTEVTVAGITYARFIEIINGYTVTFEDGQYAVRLEGSNNNIFDEGIINRNQVSIIPTNSAGLIVTEGGGTNAARASGAYDGVGQIEMTVWLVRSETTVSTPTSCSVDWRNQNGTLLFNATSSSPDAQGHFSLSQAQALVAGEAYYLVVSVTDSQGTIVTSRGAAVNAATTTPEGTGGTVFPIYGLQL